MEIKNMDVPTYQSKAKKYVINMMSKGRRTLHIKHGCQFSNYIQYHIDFDTLSNAEKSGVEFLKCKLCFPQKHGK